MFALFDDMKFVKACSGKTGRGFRFALSCLMHAASYAKWRDYLSQPHMMTLRGDTRCDFQLKIFRPFLRNCMRVPQKVTALIDHYSLLAAKLDEALFERILNEEPVHITTMVGKYQDEYALSLIRGRRYGKEGELTFQIEKGESGELLATATGCLTLDEHGLTQLVIGGIQGAMHQGKADIIRATRSLDGLRPKAAAFEALCAFALLFDAHTVHMPSLKNHIAHSWKWWRNRKITAEYDTFWIGLGAQSNKDGDYTLSLPLPRRKPEDISTKKRGDWKKRQDRLATLYEAVRNVCIPDDENGRRERI